MFQFYDKLAGFRQKMNSAKNTDEMSKIKSEICDYVVFLKNSELYKIRILFISRKY